MSEHKRCGCVEQYHASDCPACRGTGLIPPVICDEWNSARDELSALRASVAELEKALDAEKKQSAFYDLQAQRIMVQRDAAESRASAAVEAHSELLSRIAGDGTLDAMERAVAAEYRVTELETALSTLLDAAERQAAGFPLEAEQWFAVRDYARARLPEKRADGAEEVERG